MKKLLFAAAALLVLSTAAPAAVITNLGQNPTSAGGNFSNAPGVGVFEDQFTFSLANGPQFITIASVTNTFASLADFIGNFNAAVWTRGLDGIVNNADDVAVIGPVSAGACSPPTAFCQGMAGSALLAPGLYYVEIRGTAGSTAGYAGNISTAAVPGPLAGAGLPGLLFALGGVGAWWRRRRSRG